MRTIQRASLAICLICFGAASSVSRAAPVPQAPSFSCTATSLSATEKQICGNTELAGYDRELAGLYQAKLQGAAPLDKQTLVQDQRAWLQKRNACGGSLDCIKGAYLTKIYDLQTSPAAGNPDQAAAINAAIPLSNDAQSALSDMRRRVADKSARAGIESQLKLKMQLRALTCVQSLGIAPGLSSQDLHDRYGGSPCFAQQDDDIAGWLGLRTVGYMLTLPPLRPLPAAAPQNITDPMGAISRVFFAGQAGVVAVQSTKDVEMIDLASGAPISTQIDLDGPLTGISPNGRIYISQDNRRNGRLRFFDSQDASPIADPVWGQYATEFLWLDRQTTLNRDPVTHEPVLYDFTSGSTAPLESGTPYFYSITPIPRTDGSFLETANTGITEFKLVHGSDGKPQAQVVRQPEPSEQSRVRQASYGTGGILADGQRYVHVSNSQLAITYLNDLHTESVDLGIDFEVQIAVPTSDPDKVIIGGITKHKPGIHGAWEQWELHAYSLKDQTLTQLANERDLAGHQMGMVFI